MKRKLLLTILCAITGLTFASETPKWLRNCKISPDGTTIAFTYKGDIFTVPATGGETRQITSLDSYDTTPIWSPDGENIVFSSNREGSFDLYIVSKKGGTPKRLTTNSAAEYPEAFLNNDEILYTAQIMPDTKYGQFPSGNFKQVYKVSVNGGRPTLFSSEYMESISVDKSGKKLIYNDKKGYEDKWRKHHISSITRDIWTTNVDGTRKFTKITSFKGEDRNPVWAGDGDTFYYLSEQDGTSNIHRSSLSEPGKQKQITKHSKHPVRFLSAANDGTLCYAYDGEIYTIKDGGSPKKVSVSLTADLRQPSVSRHYYNGIGNGSQQRDQRSCIYSAWRRICHHNGPQRHTPHHRHSRTRAQRRHQRRRTHNHLLGRARRSMGHLQERTCTQRGQILHIRYRN